MTWTKETKKNQERDLGFDDSNGWFDNDLTNSNGLISCMTWT